MKLPDREIFVFPMEFQWFLVTSVSQLNGQHLFANFYTFSQRSFNVFCLLPFDNFWRLPFDNLMGNTCSPTFTHFPTGLSMFSGWFRLTTSWAPTNHQETNGKVCIPCFKALPLAVPYLLVLQATACVMPARADCNASW